jgi:GT2 family glycosyltransferase
MTQSTWTAIVVNYNGATYLGPCLLALQHTFPPPSATIVIDNASTDDSLIELHAFPRVEALVQRQNLGFAAGANVGLSATVTDYAVILNPDVEVAPDFGAALLAAFDRHPRLAAAGSLLTHPGLDRIQHAGGVLERPLMTTRHRGYGESDFTPYLADADVDFVTGGALGLRLAALAEIGGFDERFSPVYYEDVDLCVRLRSSGWRVMLIPALRAEHHEGVTLKREPAYFRHLHRNRLRFAMKHLSRAEWSYQFVPAELDRLRRDLAHLSHASDFEVSGATAVEAILRGLDGPENWGSASSLPLWPAPSADIDIARTHIDVSGTSSHSRFPLVGWLRNKINNLGPRWYVDPAFAQQREFNAAVVRALDTHDSLHREQTAALLLVALDALTRIDVNPGYRTDAPPEASNPAP